VENLQQQSATTTNLNGLQEAFHLMWDPFPFIVMLIQKDRTIIDVNASAKAMGINPGVKCFQLSGESKVHANCLANQALKEKQARRQTAYNEAFKCVYDSYWLPIAGHDDLYVHFGIDITEHANPARYPQIANANG
jgi:hypothetical protein